LSYIGWINFGLALWINFELAKTPLFGIFSTGTEKGGFTGFSGIDKFIKKRKGAWNVLIFPQNTDSLIPGVFDGG